MTIAVQHEFGCSFAVADRFAFAIATRTSKFIIVSIIQITHARLQSLANEPGLRCRRRLYPAWIRAIAMTKTVVLLASVEAATSKVSSLETIAVCSS